MESTNTHEKRYRSSLPRKAGAPPFWTLTPPRLWLTAATVGLLAAAAAVSQFPVGWQSSSARLWWVVLGAVFLLTTRVVVFHINSVWNDIMHYRPDEIEEIPASRAQFVWRRLPRAIIVSLAPYLLTWLSCYLIHRFF